MIIQIQREFNIEFEKIEKYDQRSSFERTVSQSLQSILEGKK